MKPGVLGTSSARTGSSSTPTQRTCDPCARRSGKTSEPRRTPSPPSGRVTTSRRWSTSAEKASAPGGVRPRFNEVATSEREDQRRMETQIPGATENLWDAGKGEGLSPLEALAY